MSSPRWFSVTAKASDQVEAFIYDEISDYGTTAKDFISSIQPYKDRAITLRLNSPGGSVFNGLTIYNYLRGLNVTTQVDGIAASIASVVALAGRRVNVASNGFFMIHNPMGLAVGDRRSMDSMGGVLEKLTDSMVETYANETGQPEAQIRKWMDDETWFTAQEAKDAGFADEISASVAFSASASLGRIAAKVPASLGRREVSNWTQLCIAANTVSLGRRGVPSSVNTRTLSDGELLALCDEVLGSGFSREATATCANPAETRERCIMSLAFAGVKVPGFEKESAKWTQSSLSPVNSAMRDLRQSKADAFMARPVLSTAQVLDLGAFVFGANGLAETVRSCGSNTDKQRAAVIARLDNCGVKCAGVPELDGRGGMGPCSAYQKRVDEWLSRNNQR